MKVSKDTWHLPDDVPRRPHVLQRANDEVEAVRVVEDREHLSDDDDAAPWSRKASHCPTLHPVDSKAAGPTSPGTQHPC